MAELILTFPIDGTPVKKETKGFTGKKCMSATKFIEDALGTPEGRKFKSEYYEDTNKEQEQDRLKH